MWQLGTLGMESFFIAKTKTLLEANAQKILSQKRFFDLSKVSFSRLSKNTKTMSDNNENTDDSSSHYKDAETSPKPMQATTSTSTSTLPSTDSDSGGDEVSDASIMEMVRNYFSQTLNLNSGSTVDKEFDIVDKVIPDLTFEGLTSHWRKHGFKNIVTMVGAGISTSAGIPDFRSAGSGLYNNLKKYKLPHPTAIFDMDYFEKNPAPFFALAKELYPGSFVPTPAHYFVRLLFEKGLLQRHYTQNIDTLDRLAGLPEEKIVEAHGSFHTNHCLQCKAEYDMAWMKAKIMSDEMPRCVKCEGVVKPDIVFFGENLPAEFYTCPQEDFEDCDLLIIMGTSLEVQPFASLIQRAGPRCIRLLINRDAVGRSSFAPWMKTDESYLHYGKPKNTRDVAFLGDCDVGVLALAEGLGWQTELQELIQSGQDIISNNANESKQDKESETKVTQ